LEDESGVFQIWNIEWDENNDRASKPIVKHEEFEFTFCKKEMWPLKLHEVSPIYKQWEFSNIGLDNSLHMP